MKNTANQEKQYGEVKWFLDIPRSENDVYRLARKEFKGREFVDIRIFFRDRDERDRLIPTLKGICFDETLRQEVITGLIKARQVTLEGKPEGETLQSKVICDVPFSEKEVCRITKGVGSKNTFVDVRRFFKKGGEYIPYRNKGVAINEATLDEVITELMKMDSVSAS